MQRSITDAARRRSPSARPSRPKRSSRPSRPHRAWLVGIALVVGAILWLTLRPGDPPGFPTGTNLRPFEHHGRALQALLAEHPNRGVLVYYLLSDVLGNVALFVPLGVAVAGALGPRQPAVRLAAAGAAGAVLSAAIEGVQLLVPGRATDVDDVIFNTLGALVGAAGLLVGERLIRPGGPSRRRPRSPRGSSG
jgi:VanZ family protein